MRVFAVLIAFCVALVSAKEDLPAGDSLRIGVKYRPTDCTRKAANGDKVREIFRDGSQPLISKARFSRALPVTRAKARFSRALPVTRGAAHILGPVRCRRSSSRHQSMAGAGLCWDLDGKSQTLLSTAGCFDADAGLTLRHLLAAIWLRARRRRRRTEEEDRGSCERGQSRACGACARWRFSFARGGRPSSLDSARCQSQCRGATVPLLLVAESCVLRAQVSVGRVRAHLRARRRSSPQRCA